MALGGVWEALDAIAKGAQGGFAVKDRLDAQQAAQDAADAAAADKKRQQDSIIATRRALYNQMNPPPPGGDTTQGDSTNPPEGGPFVPVARGSLPFGSQTDASGDAPQPEGTQPLPTVKQPDAFNPDIDYDALAKYQETNARINNTKENTASLKDWRTNQNTLGQGRLAVAQGNLGIRGELAQPKVISPETATAARQFLQGVNVDDSTMTDQQAVDEAAARQMKPNIARAMPVKPTRTGTGTGSGLTPQMHGVTELRLESQNADKAVPKDMRGPFGAVSWRPPFATPAVPGDDNTAPNPAMAAKETSDSTALAGRAKQLRQALDAAKQAANLPGAGGAPPPPATPPPGLTGGVGDLTATPGINPIQLAQRAANAKARLAVNPNDALSLAFKAQHPELFGPQ